MTIVTERYVVLSDEAISEILRQREHLGPYVSALEPIVAAAVGSATNRTVLDVAVHADGWKISLGDFLDPRSIAERARRSGLSFEQSTAALSVLSRNCIDGVAAGSNLKSALALTLLMDNVESSSDPQGWTSLQLLTAIRARLTAIASLAEKRYAVLVAINDLIFWIDERQDTFRDTSPNPSDNTLSLDGETRDADPAE